MYWNGSSWQSGQAWNLASGTTSWSYGFSPASDDTYTVVSKATDNATNVETPGAGHSFTIDKTAPTVTINQAAGQADPTNASPINFTVVFSEPVTDFATGDVTLSGTAGATTADGHRQRHDLQRGRQRHDRQRHGDRHASPPAWRTTRPATPTPASTSTDNTVTYDTTAPTVTINQAAGQADPTNASPINFTVVFSEPVTDFATGDVTLSGTAGATTGHRHRQRHDLQRGRQRHDRRAAR